MTREITLDDVIEFIIRNCDDREAMDKISRTSFPFTTKYLENDQSKKKYYFNKTWGDWSKEHKGDNLTTTDYPIITYCSDNIDKED